MHPKKVENLVNFTPKERFYYFVRHCADFEEVWGLVTEEDSWIIFKDKNGNEIFPVWPHGELAALCTFEEHKKMGATPQMIKLDSFLENCIPDMISQNVDFGIFYDDKREGFVIDGERLKKHIKNEVSAVWE